MAKRGLLAALGIVLLAGTAQAQHAIMPETTPSVVPAVTREVCTISEWGFDEIRTDCKTAVLPAPKSNPALSGLCTTYYGRRTCY
jgi:hypothetical protein